MPTGTVLVPEPQHSISVFEQRWEQGVALKNLSASHHTNPCMIGACEPGQTPRGCEDTHLLELTPWTPLPGPLPLTTLQPKVYFRVGREEKEERKPKGENLRKGVREPRPPDTSFHQ